MAHQLETMAYVRQTPWHGLGERLSERQPIEVWARHAGMNWRIEASPVQYQGGEAAALHEYPEQRVLYRSDTRQPLSVVSRRYQVVQPREILEFYRDLTEVAGFELETAGVLRGGKKFWALAKTGQKATIKRKDEVQGYLLLATSCDGTLATTATPTTIRVVCANTLAMALDGNGSAIKVGHNTVFDANRVKQELGVAVFQWDSFMYRMKTLSNRHIRSNEAEAYFCKVLGDPDWRQGMPMTNERALKRVQSLYDGHGYGASLDSARQTAWGLLNAVTQYVDHDRRAKNAEYRLDSAWFGQGAQIKQRALDAALQLVH